MVATTSADASVERRIATHVVVLGMGDVSRGDEGVGVRVTEALRDLVPPGVRLAAHDGNGTGFPELEGATHLLVIDCVDVGRAPGAVVVFDGTVLTPCVAAASFRDTSLVHYLVLAGMHADAPEEVALLGVQPSDTDGSSDLSEPVEAALPALVEEALAVLRFWLDPSAPAPPRRSRPRDC